ncbi:hypothetical protein GCM10010464_03700 [Pseudonocardia yunnanensis]
MRRDDRRRPALGWESILATVPEAAVGIFVGGGAGTCLPGSRPGSPLMIGKSGPATVLDAGAWSQTMIIAGLAGRLLHRAAGLVPVHDRHLGTGNRALPGYGALNDDHGREARDGPCLAGGPA